MLENQNIEYKSIYNLNLRLESFFKFLAIFPIITNFVPASTVYVVIYFEK